MEGLTHLVDESLARNGVETNLDHRRLQWSNWTRCESPLSVPDVPYKPGLLALSEEVFAPGSSGGKGMLAVFEISEADDLCAAISSLFMRTGRLRERLEAGRCFIRYTIIEDAIQRRVSRASLWHWMSSSAELAYGIAG